MIGPINYVFPARKLFMNNMHDLKCKKKFFKIFSLIKYYDNQD